MTTTSLEELDERHQLHDARRAPLRVTPGPIARGIGARSAARIAGAGYLAIFVLAILANFGVREGLVVADDAQATVANIADNEALFRFGLVAFLVVFVLDVLIAWALHMVFRDRDPDLSRLAAWLRLTYTAFLGVGLVAFFVVLQLLGGADHLAAFGDAQIASQVMLALEAFDAAWLIGLVAFGLHLVVLGWMILRSGVASRVLGALLVVAGSAYMVDTTANALLPGYDELAGVFLALVAIPSVVAEAWLGIWLLLGGTEGSARRRRSAEPASAA